jgi:hypothetical protein
VLFVGFYTQYHRCICTASITEFRYFTSPSPGILQLISAVPAVRIYTEPAILRLAVPDFSMPYNVITLSSSVLAFAFGSLFNLLTRQFYLKGIVQRKPIKLFALVGKVFRQSKNWAMRRINSDTKSTRAESVLGNENRDGSLLKKGTKVTE